MPVRSVAQRQRTRYPSHGSTPNTSARVGGEALLVVESPAKAKTIQQYVARLGIQTFATLGHVRDLPVHELGVDLGNNFRPSYVVIPERESVVKRLQALAAQKRVVFLASDPDREGEAIAWHISVLLRPHLPPAARVQRVVFHEITPAAIHRALQAPRDIDVNLVLAQQARRVLDRLIGYLLSPYISARLGGEARQALSAGRVQSVALRLVVERERAIRQFQARPYWLFTGVFAPLEDPEDTSRVFKARLVRLNDRPPQVSSAEEADALCARLRAAHYVVHDLRDTRVHRAPPPPFTTSSFQQSAARDLRLSPERAMALAQMLYEGVPIGDQRIGLITYMRTDSTRVAEHAVEAARQWIREHFGDAYLPRTPRTYRPSRAAQDAHEAIRPTDVRRTPEWLRQSGARLPEEAIAVYALIWRRFVASQMADAQYALRSIDVDTIDQDLRARFCARARQRLFDGYMTLYADPEDNASSASDHWNDENSAERQAENEEEKSEEEKGDDGEATALMVDRLPDLLPSTVLQCLDVTHEQRWTAPPPRYTEATLVRALERHGIGRPSTYAAILSRLKSRRYVQFHKRALMPTPLGERVIDELLKAAPEFFEYDFTRQVEERLDKIAEGRASSLALLREVYERIQRVQPNDSSSRRRKP